MKDFWNGKAWLDTKTDMLLGAPTVEVEQSSVLSSSGAGGSGDRTRNTMPGPSPSGGLNGGGIKGVKPWLRGVASGYDYYFYSLYREFWEARKIVDIPPYDMTREGWEWVAPEVDDELIGLVSETEKKLNVLKAFFTALKMERLYGGSAILLGTADIQEGSELNKDEAAQEPLNPDSINEGDLVFMRALPRALIYPAKYDYNPFSMEYLNPEVYEIRGKGGSQKVHRSRLLIFDGGGRMDPMIGGIGYGYYDDYRKDGFGTSVLEDLYDDIIRAGSIRQAGYQIVNILSIMIFKKKEFKGLSITQTGEAKKEKLQDILDQVSIYRGAILDKDDELQEYSTSGLSGLAQLLEQQLQVLSAASDIPAPRYLGQAPGGLNATGKGDLVNHYDGIRSQQKIKIGPQLDKLKTILVRSATGKDIPEITYKFKPLMQLTEDQQADRRQKDWAVINGAVMAGLVSDEWAIAEALAREIFLNNPELFGDGDSQDDMSPDQAAQRLADIQGEGEEGVDGDANSNTPEPEP